MPSFRAIIVCGGRDYGTFPAHAEYIRKTLEKLLSKYEFHAILHGGATGADARAAEWAKARGLAVFEFPALWGKHGKGAGPIRNRQMAQVERKLEALFTLAFPGSNGTLNMIGESKRAGIRVIKKGWKVSK